MVPSTSSDLIGTTGTLVIYQPLFPPPPAPGAVCIRLVAFRLNEGQRTSWLVFQVRSLASTSHVVFVVDMKMKSFHYHNVMHHTH